MQLIFKGFNAFSSFFLGGHLAEAFGFTDFLVLLFLPFGKFLTDDSVNVRVGVLRFGLLFLRRFLLGPGFPFVPGFRDFRRAVAGEQL